jgi:hypothetical protein
MKLKLARGTTSKTLKIFVQDDSQPAPAGLTGLSHNTSGLSWYYIREGDATATQVPLVAATVGSYTSGGFQEVSATHMPGVYEIGVPDSALAQGASVVMMLRGAANMVPVLIEIELDAVNYQDSVRAGLTALPNAAASSSGGLLTFGTGAGQVAPTAGAVVANLNLDQPVPVANPPQTVGDALNAARAQGFGKWVISGTTLSLFAPDGTTPVRIFTLDSPIAPTQRT